MIRRGGPEDLELVFAIQRASSIAGFANVFPPERYPYPDAKVREELRAQLADPENAVLVDEAARGFALVGRGVLYRLFVREEAWGSGVGSALHDAALEALRERGARSAELWCLADNGPARRFYERRGWRLTGEETHVPYPPQPLDLCYARDL